MANNFKSNLPKVISKANKEMSSLIETDIAKESALLKDLVDQVLQANMEIKKNNNQRITETKRKMAELDKQIDDLNVRIDLVDRETVIQQLNEMIDAENKIFAARQEIRFFDHEQLPSRLSSLTDIYIELSASVRNINDGSSFMKGILEKGNDEVLTTQLEATNAILKQMDEIYQSKTEFAQDGISTIRNLRESIADLELRLTTELEQSIVDYQDLVIESSSTFTETDQTDEIMEDIIQAHNQKLEDIKLKKEQLEETYNQEKQYLLDGFKEYVQKLEDQFAQKNKAKIDKEKALQQQIDDKIKQIRFDIMNAERAGDYEKIEKLMKDLKNLEKQKETKTVKEISKSLTKTTKKEREKTLKKLQNLRLKYEEQIHQQDYETAFEGISFEEAKILHKIKSDFDGLQSDLQTNQKRIDNITSFLKNRIELYKEISSVRLQLRLDELELMRQNEMKELMLFNFFYEQLYKIKKAQVQRDVKLNRSTEAHELIQLEQEFAVKKATLNSKLDHEVQKVDKRILRKRNETMIELEKQQEELNSEILYQESLVTIAQKEHELQLIKVKSLYENERGLAEEQRERIKLGVQVNDTFVKATLQNQLLFAQQQINIAESEYDIRIESIALTHDQEVQYANKKIEYYKQRYEYDKQRYRKELQDKLEDLNYKLLLFTDDKDNKEIAKKIKDLTDYYEGLIDEIEEKESQDPEIIRYEKVIDDAERRQQQAINEAESLKDQTIDSFSQLYEMTKQKYDQIEDVPQEETKGIMPVLNNSAVSSADERLKQATKEADELFQDRIREPKRIIEETKQKIIELNNTEETDSFIEEQKELKRQLLKDHKEQMDLLEQQRKEVLEPKIITLQAQLETSPELPDIQFDFPQSAFRQESDIESDYKVLIQNEEKRRSEFIQQLESETKERIIQLQTILKEANSVIKDMFKPYQRYIKKASKGVNRKKKALQKEFKKRWKKRLPEVTKELKKIKI